jgi:hypothetical protein
MEQRFKEGFVYGGQDVMATYGGSGVLATKSGARVACEFRADQDSSGVVQLILRRISPNDFAFHLLPLIETGAAASFRGRTRSGAVVVMEEEQGGRPLSLDEQGYRAFYFLPHKLAVYEKSPPTVRHRFLLTNFAFSPFTHLGEPPHHPPSHRLLLSIDNQNVEIEIKPLTDYVERVISLWQTRPSYPPVN